MMLFNRKDTPRRIAKYCRRGFGSVIPSTSMSHAEEKLDEAKKLREKPPRIFIDMDIFEDESDMYADLLIEEYGVYSETRLPRGYGITPKVVKDFIVKYQAKARSEGKDLITTFFNGYFVTKPKVVAKAERWWQWGMIGC
eukprot:4604206-Karenia_brevis.AAC.1